MRQVALESVLNPNSRSPSPQPVPHVEEQRALRNETIAAFRHAVEEDDEDDGLFVPREKTKDEREREEEEYQSFLKREVGQDLAELVTVDADMVLGEESFEQKDGESKKNKNKKKDDKKSKAKSASKTKHEADQEFLLKCVNWHLLLSFFYFPHLELGSATSSTVVGLTDQLTECLHTRKSPPHLKGKARRHKKHRL